MKIPLLWKMKKQSKVRAAQIAVGAAVLPILLYAYAEGPPPKLTAAPGDNGTCTSCHLGPVNSGKGNVKVTFPNGLTYTPGVKQRLAVVVSDPDQRRWGFQLSARLNSDPANQQAGDLAAGSDGFTQVLCEDGSPKPQGSNCPAGAPLEFIEHTPSGTRPGRTGSAEFEFDWTPPATDAGKITFYVAGNAADGNFQPSGDHIYTANFTLAPAATTIKPVIAKVVNGADFLPGIGQAAWITITGSNLAKTTRKVRSDEIVEGRIPTRVEGTSVTIAWPAFVDFISPTQINALAPDGITGSAQVVVSNNGISSAPANTVVEGFSPALFTWPGGYTVATHKNFTLAVKNGEFKGKDTTPAKPGEVIILWGTGFGPTSPSVPAGQNTPTDKVHHTVNAPIVTVGGIAATDYHGTELAPGFAGLYQLAFRVPENAPDGDLPIVVQIGGLSSDAHVLLTVKQ